MSQRQDNRVVRLTEATYQRLLVFIAGLTKTAMQDFKAGAGELPGRITVDNAVSVLLDRQDAHKARSARSNAKKKQADVDNVDNVNNGEE